VGSRRGRSRFENIADSLRLLSVRRHGGEDPEDGKSRGNAHWMGLLRSHPARTWAKRVLLEIQNIRRNYYGNSLFAAQTKGEFFLLLNKGER
jgi:hypothetical protein